MFGRPIWNVVFLLKILSVTFRGSSFAQWDEEGWQFLKLNGSRDIALF
jgi:hypothetical protein